MSSASRLILMVLVCTADAFSAQAKPLTLGSNPLFYSDAGREHEVEFDAVFRSEYSSLDDLQTLTDDRKASLTRRELVPLMDYLFGPLTYNALGSPQRSVDVRFQWDQARVNGEGKVEIPYHYKGVWIVSTLVSAQGQLQLPVPFNRKVVYSPKWKSCTDQAPEHQTTSFYWYFWDPRRWGCDQTLGVQYQMITAKVGAQTPNQPRSYPEYDRMLADGVMSLTLGFGYVNDPDVFSPDTDSDVGARAYQTFVRQFRANWGAALTEEPITQGEYKSAQGSDLLIGHRFSGSMNGAKVTVNIVMAAGIDQMEIFAKSFAHDHDDVFGWFGHSRVGSGFDAERFGQMVARDPAYYSISTDYQIIYWAGCNSYSYYTLPFFQFKGGTKNLDIIANGLPSFFSLNAPNAMLTAQTFLNWQARTSYQELVDAIEKRAAAAGTTVLVSVLGDEDNPLPQ